MNDILLKMLREAYSTEIALMPVLEAQINDSVAVQSMHQKLLDHLEETREHSRTLKKEIERLAGNGEGDALTVEGPIANLMTSVQSLKAGESVEEERVKDVIGGITLENFEIALYTSLIAAAEEAGDQQLISCLEKILAQESAMEAWLSEQLPVATKDYVQRPNQG